jgi:1,4-dihydroxy-2-naphthoate octaprenyltransferase
VANPGRPLQKRIDPSKVPAPKNKPKTTRGLPPKVAVRKATVSDWIGGARLRTLPLAISPVALGTASAFLVSSPGWHWVRALLALAVALAIQIGVNYANDYSDGVRGTDKHRVGPSRLTGSGAAQPRTVLTVALVFFGIGALAGLALVILSGYWWLLAVGAASIAAAYLYTGGKRPYGYYGLGEVFVFVFFGLVATLGTTFTQVGTLNLESWLTAIAAGFFACAVLMVNNLRDIDQDRQAKKRTLAVLVGSFAGRVLFAVFVAIPYGILAFLTLFYDNAQLVFFSLLAAIPAIVITLTAKTAPEFILALKLTSLAALLFGVGLAAAIVF